MEALNFALCAIEYGIIFAVFDFLLIPRYNKLITVAAAAISTVLVYVLSDLNIVIKALFFVLWLTIVSSALYRNKLYIKTAFSLLMLYTFYIIDVIFGNLFSLVLGQQFLDVFYSDILTRAIVCLLIKLVDAAVFVVIAKSFSKVDFNLGKNIWIMFNVVMGVFLAVTVAFIQLYSQVEQDGTAAVMYLILSLSFFVMSMIVIYFFTYLCSSFQQKQRLYMLETSYKSMEEKLSVQTENSRKLQKVRHDIKNHLMNIRVLLKEENYDKANSLLSEAIGQTDDINISIEKSTGNSIIDAAVAYKAAICKNRNIRFDYEFQTLPQLNINDIDISSVISNLLDNAIEAAAKSAEPHIILKIKMHGKYLSIVVNNTYSNDIRQSANGGLLSTKPHSDEHGQGTQIIKQIANKYDGDSSWKVSEDFFNMSVILKNIK